MKLIGRFKHIVFAVIVLIIAIFVGLESFSGPDINYENTPASTLEKIVTENYLITTDEIDNQKHVLVDVRSPYEYERGHILNAVNIPAAEILDDENQKYLKGVKNSGKLAVLYGDTPEEANIPFMLLYKLGCDDIKLLPVEIEYEQNNMIASVVEIEKEDHDIKKFIQESIEKTEAAKQKRIVVQAPVEKPQPVKKKKKRLPEGGCY